MFKKLKAPASEHEISSNWKFKDKVYISCVCITFNHEKYIEDALIGMLSQISEHRFEIVVHDDVSTDKTRDILEKYKARFPSIIKLVFQKENQYSLGKKITPLAVSYSSGNYIALCEGDDFWIDRYKLHKQFKVLEDNGNINICFTAAIGLYPNNKTKILCNHSNEMKFFSKEKVFCGGGGFMPTPSLMIRRIIFDDIPGFFHEASVGDFYLQTICSKSEGAVYLPIISTVYRFFSVTSWSNESLNYSIERIQKNLTQDLHCLKLLAKFIDVDINALNFSLSRLFYHSACLALSSGQKELFKQYIEESYLIYRGISKKQVAYFMLRDFPDLLGMIKKINLKRLR
ncbi:glycosyltransferase family 2 protein [Photobacterium sp. CCB-ST2H9]|uniref:glycosyltransferase family 2 protein n=1 Tax=Photobacterium sp. CCB-ST2H9 TaxID=2912855 RepID=UPI002005FE0B|nr:glycosyltransferase family 2 protein [Photobacterium sp. CCB-ST2H9]UTM56557.1 glycosyltransferase family 2 protein [Photobacterium sp. CCB-ST2H9]